MPDPALQLKDVTVRLGGREILGGISAEVLSGEFIGIFGPNGAGKSTLMRAVLGLCPIAGGSIRLFGSAPGPERSNVGYMPQARGTFEGTALSARAMVEAVENGSCWGIPWPSRKGREEVDRVLELAGASSYAQRPFSVLSGGEKQRITLAQSLLSRPKLLILDEPLASLDPKNQMLLVERVQTICRETGSTILFIAHDLNPLLRVMDRVLYLASGKARLGTVQDVVNSESLSQLYGSPMEVIEAAGRIFILSAEENVIESARHG